MQNNQQFVCLLALVIADLKGHEFGQDSQRERERHREEQEGIAREVEIERGGDVKFNNEIM